MLSKITTILLTAISEKKKKRKRSKKKKVKTTTLLGTDLKQSTPPRVLLSSLFPSGDYPTGELVPYSGTSRTTDEEVRYNSRLWDSYFLSDYRQAAEIHSQVRQYAQSHLIKPGATLLSIANGIEDTVRALCGHQGLDEGDALKAGMGFPTGLCLNNVAAHWTPNPGQKDVVLGKEDVLKVDFGVHVGGRIVDSAFTVAFDHTYDNLLASVKDATNTGIKVSAFQICKVSILTNVQEAGIDARMSDIGAAIQEVMESYEVEIGGKTFPVKAVRNITGHDIKRYHIHGGKQIPFIKNNNRDKMEEGEVFAIETFGSTGTGRLDDGVSVEGYTLLIPSLIFEIVRCLRLRTKRPSLRRKSTPLIRKISPQDYRFQFRDFSFLPSLLRASWGKELSPWCKDLRLS
jgi:methionyl aminopeptidase